MKWTCLPPLALALFCLAGCESFNQPLGGDYDPLASPGSRNSLDVTNASAEAFKPGQYVTAATNSTAFFSKRPTGNAEAELLLAAGTSMRVIKTDGSFVKVELDNDGKVGYVNSAMLTDGKSTQSLPSGAVQVYPPVGGAYESALPLPSGATPLPAAPPTDLSSGAPLPPISPPPVPEFTTPSAPVNPEPSVPAVETEKPKESVELPEPAGSKSE